MNTSEVAEQFLNHYRDRGTTFLLDRPPGPRGSADAVVYVRHASGPDIAITAELFGDRVRGYLEDSGTPATARDRELITTAALAQLAAHGGNPAPERG